MPKVSIITTAYKHQDFIAETIESILSQSFTDWELLIGDDSPDDLTWIIIQSYVDNYPYKIKAWHNYPNKGIVDNMNFLIEKVSNDSEYVAFLEGDDLFTPDNLEEKLKIFEKFPEVGMVYNNLDFINEKGEIVEKDFFSKVSKITKNEKLDLHKYLYYLDAYFSFSTMMVNKKVFKDIKIENPNNDKHFLNSDCIFFADVGYNYNIYGIEKELTHYRKHLNNISKDNIKLIDDLLISVKYIVSKYSLNRFKYNYKLISIKSRLSFDENKRFNAIYFGLLSFKYDFRKDLFKRFSVIILSLLPRKVSVNIFNKYDKFIGK